MLNRGNLLGALLLLAAGALLLHSRIHPIIREVQGENVLIVANLMAFLLCLTDVILVTLLFCFPASAIYGYVINGFLAIFATILMGHFSLHKFVAESPAFWDWLYSSTLPDIGLAWADFFIGRALFLTYQNAAD
jgi:hypothetical protein